MKSKKNPEEFYNRILKTLLEKNLPFMIGGTYAFREYTGIERATKDIDIITTEEDYPRILKVLTENGYKTILHELELNWLAKVQEGDYFVDLMFAERNGLHRVDKTWLAHARQGTILGHQVKLVPVEEMIRSKAYIQNRDRHDGIDVVHLILKQGKTVNWQLLLDKMDPHWEIIAGHILTFLFVYPSERLVIPPWVIEKLIKKIQERLSHPPTKDRITRGLLLSKDYAIGVSKWGFTPIRELV